MTINFNDPLFLSDSHATDLIESWHADAELLKDCFPIEQLLAFKQKPSSLPLALALKTFYLAVSLFPDDEVRERLEKIGLSRSLHQRWFIPLSDLLEAYRLLTDDGYVQLSLSNVLIATLGHLRIKINTDLMIWLGMTAELNDKLYATRLKKDIYTLYRRLKNGPSSIRPLTAYEEALLEIITRLEEITGDPKEARKLMLQFSAGNTKKNLLRWLVESATAVKRDNAFYRRFFPLFKLLCPDEVMLSEEEFKMSEQHWTKSYAAYQAKRVRDLIR